MIRSFKSKETEALHDGVRVRRFATIEKIARRKLVMLNAANVLNDLAVPPCNKLESLKGNRQGLYSIRVNDQYRICFTCGITPLKTSRSLITTEGGLMPKKTEVLPPVHPGEVLREDFLEPLGLSANKLARDLYVPVTRIGEIVNERRGITADTALRLARYFGTSAEFWLNLQKDYELSVARRQAGEEIAGRVQPRNAA